MATLWSNTNPKRARDNNHTFFWTLLLFKKKKKVAWFNEGGKGPDVSVTNPEVSGSVPEVVEFTEDLFLFDVAADVAAEWRLTHAARETAHVPAHVVHLSTQKQVEQRVGKKKYY